MRVIVAGSRHCQDRSIVANALMFSKFHITEIVSGGANGIDRLAELEAERCGIPVKVFEADWSLGRKAGPMRNASMAEYADALILIWDGSSTGSASMLQQARRHGIPVEQVILPSSSPSLF